MNPCAGKAGLPHFECGPFSHLGTSPRILTPLYNYNAEGKVRQLQIFAETTFFIIILESTGKVCLSWPEIKCMIQIQDISAGNGADGRRFSSCRCAVLCCAAAISICGSVRTDGGTAVHQADGGAEREAALRRFFICFAKWQIFRERAAKQR